MKFSHLSSSLVLSLSLVSGAHAADITNVKDLPKWFQKEFKSEKKIKGTTDIQIEQLNVAGVIVGKATLAAKDEGYWLYSIDVGAAYPVECHVYTQFDGPANSLHSLIDFGLNATVQSTGKEVSLRNTFAIDVGVIEATPYLQLDTVYTVGAGAETLVGFLKAASAKTGKSLQICMHNEIGYRETFATVFESFVSAFAQSQKNDHFFESIYSMSFNGIPVGYINETYLVDADGDVEIGENSSFLVPVDNTNVSRSDTVGTEWSRPDGSLINGTTYTIENSTLTSQFNIQDSDEKWQVSGQSQGKEINLELDHSGYIDSGYGSYSEMIKLLNSEAESASLPMWLAEADPSTVANVTISKIKDNPNANLLLDMGPIKIEFLGDEFGVIQSGTMDQGGFKMDIELLHASGTPVIPEAASTEEKPASK